MLRSTRWMTVAPLLLVGATALAQPEEPATVERIRAAIADPAGKGVPGCAVGIFRNGEITATVTSGSADVATGRGIDGDTLFYAASVSKQFTAVALMQLVVAGKLGLDDDVRKHLPELPAYGSKITPLMLLNHTAGIRDSLSLVALAGQPDLSRSSYGEALALVLRQRETKFVPGTRYDYSNGGYLLLAEIIARVSGEPFHAYVNRNVLAPAGMSRSYMLSGARPSDPNVARGYRKENDAWVAADGYPLFGGSGGLMTTVNDLAKWDRDVDRVGKVWTPEVKRLMTMPGRFNNGSLVVRSARGIPYGNALLVGPHWFHHTGGATGFRTLYGRHTADRLGLALLCNSGEGESLQRADAVVRALDPRLPLVSEPSSDVETIDGRYRTEDLDAVYRLETRNDVVEVTVLPVAGVGPRRVVQFRISEDGTLEGPGMSIVPDDDRRGITLVTSRVSLHLMREK